MANRGAVNVRRVTGQPYITTEPTTTTKQGQRGPDGDRGGPDWVRTLIHVDLCFGRAERSKSKPIHTYVVYICIWLT